MEPNLDNVFTAAQRVRLTADERVRIGAPRVPVLSPYTFVHSHLIRQGMAAVLIMALAGSTTAFAASGSLPGDTLYPVKIHLNEQVESWLALTPHAQAKLAADQAIRRLGEAEELVHQGRLTEAATKEIEDRFTGKAAEVAGHVRSLRDSHDDSGADEVEQQFKKNIDTHYQSFIELEDGDGSTTPTVRAVTNTIRHHRGDESGERHDEITHEDAHSGNSGEAEQPEHDESQRD